LTLANTLKAEGGGKPHGLGARPGRHKNLEASRSPLLPLSVGGILIKSFDLYRNNLALLLQIGIVAQLPCTVATLLALGPLTGLSERVLYEFKPLFAHLLGWGALAGLFLMVGFLALHCAITRVVARRYLGQETTLADAFADVNRIGGQLFGTGLLYGVLIVLGLASGIIPGVLILIWGFFINQVVLLEGLSGMAAFRRSKQLCESPGTLGRAIVVGLLSFLVVVVFDAILGLSAVTHLRVLTLGLGPVVGLSVQMIVPQLIEAIIRPLAIVISVLFYYDVRVRHEAFDLNLLGSLVGTPGGRG
jgi:hypothetical protein